MEKPLIFDIERSTTVNGRGIRTAVFFKGCPLDCYWCHNPESKLCDAEEAFFADKCIGCGACKKADNKAAVCPTNARRVYGKEYSLSELFDVITLDKPYYDATGGGVTFSGGECMLYPEFVSELAKRCKESGISVAIDTAGFVPYDSFLKVLPYVDTFLYDIKALSPELHLCGTGKDNALILENLSRLIKTEKEIVIRVPVIPGFNEGDEVERIQSFCEENGLNYELLPYHTFGTDKLRAIRAAKR